MAELLTASAEATAWIDQVKAAHSGRIEFGSLAGSVIWSDVKGADGQQLVPLDPDELAAKINVGGFDLLRGHDPGLPQGKVLTAAVFTDTDGSKFVAALLGFYQGGRSGGFRDLGVEPSPATPAPVLLPPLSGSRLIYFSTDPREVDAAWVEDVVATAPLHVERQQLSHNAADTSQELIRIGIIFTGLLWNPYVTTIATEAGKASYAALSAWVRRLLTKAADRIDPIVDIHSHCDGCHISFLFRGTNVKRHYAAHDALPGAAARCETLVANMKSAHAAPRRIVYEFHPDDELWFPSFAELHDGRLITENNVLIAVEKLPRGLSLGLSLDEKAPRLPSTKRADS